MIFLLLEVEFCLMWIFLCVAAQKFLHASSISNFRSGFWARSSSDTQETALVDYTRLKLTLSRLGSFMCTVKLRALYCATNRSAVIHISKLCCGSGSRIRNQVLFTRIRNEFFLGPRSTWHVFWENFLTISSESLFCYLYEVLKQQEKSKFNFESFFFFRIWDAGGKNSQIRNPVSNKR
jgi:hypothetical protein